MFGLLDPTRNSNIHFTTCRIKVLFRRFKGDLTCPRRRRSPDSPSYNELEASGREEKSTSEGDEETFSGSVKDRKQPSVLNKQLITEGDCSGQSAALKMMTSQKLSQGEAQVKSDH